MLTVTPILTHRWLDSEARCSPCRWMFSIASCGAPPIHPLDTVFRVPHVRRLRGQGLRCEAAALYIP
ncbi:Hypothetical protein, putative [Bodo saltans]|uniref:Uncharacterized protein n=1 Tax=Bodo saltans TaxID=75058 RepID=A0A0S4JNS8_BODSA|nr:Hypothetical protein, putative [Bodo saltans]|eukprot:CUG93162.1 Hypothetical protein, putative [Bodo saltans]